MCCSRAVRLASLKFFETKISARRTIWFVAPFTQCAIRIYMQSIVWCSSNSYFTSRMLEQQRANSTLGRGTCSRSSPLRTSSLDLRASCVDSGRRLGLCIGLDPRRFHTILLLACSSNRSSELAFQLGDLLGSTILRRLRPHSIADWNLKCHNRVMGRLLHR